MTDTVIIGGRVILDGILLDGGSVHLRGSKIAAVSMGPLHIPGATVIDAAGRYVSPGFIDLHVHGALQRSFSDATIESFDILTRFYARYGITALQATPSALPLAGMRRVLDAYRKWRDGKYRGGSEILGVHLEGPYFSQEQRGAQPPRYIRAPGSDDLALLRDNLDIITEISLAPEVPGNVALTRELSSHGVVVAAAHSAAKEYEILPAIEAGLSHVTHIYSGSSMVIREGPYRVPGLVEVGLTHPALTVEMIADGKHLPPTLMRLITRARGTDRTCIVSDAISAAGRPEGERFESEGAEVVIQDGVAMMADMTCFAGSITPLGRMVYNLMTLIDMPLLEAVKMATVVPARVLHIENRKGRLAPGLDADVVIFDEQINVDKTIVSGQVVYDRSRQREE